MKNLNFASVFSIMILLVFSYITFLGLDYWQGGKMMLPIVLSLGLIVVVLLCVLLMCKAKATRWGNIGTLGQIFFGFIILVVFVFAMIPFTNFLRVVNDKENISSKVSETCNTAIELDNAYLAYVNKRVEDYKSNLSIISKGKEANPTVYQQCLVRASGKDDATKIENLGKSLHRRLLPDSTAIIVEKRHKWLKNSESVKVWNLLTPSNINKVDERVNGWLDNYQNLSSISYKGESENVEKFEYKSFSSTLSSLTGTYRDFQRPSVLAIIISLVCYVIMLLPYFVTEQDLAGKTKKKKGNN